MWLVGQLVRVSLSNAINEFFCFSDQVFVSEIDTVTVNDIVISVSVYSTVKKSLSIVFLSHVVDKSHNGSQSLESVCVKSSLFTNFTINE